jgi:hypothetical protein
MLWTLADQERLGGGWTWTLDHEVSLEDIWADEARRTEKLGC